MDAIDKINFYLSKKGKNGADLSRALGLSNSIYSQWNTRKTKPSNVRLPAIAEYLGVSVEDIMPDDVAAPAASQGAKKAPDPEIEGGREAVSNFISATNDRAALLAIINEATKKLQEME
jgi:transcriptional regulator with XRE-family HTH domain|nr:MAG TPA: helix-turn-helix domain protein [Caudoviricetes sp.]